MRDGSIELGLAAVGFLEAGSWLINHDPSRNELNENVSVQRDLVVESALL